MADFANRKGSKNATPMIETCTADFMVAGYEFLNLSVFLGANAMANVCSFTIRFRNVSVFSFVWGLDVYLSDAKYHEDQSNAASYLAVRLGGFVPV